MKIFVAHSSGFDYETELYTPLRESPLLKAHEFIFPHEHGREENTQEAIKNADFFLAEVSVPSTGVGIEIGWANMLHVPVVCISKNGSSVSSSLRFLTTNFIEYTDSADLTNKLAEFFK